MYVYRTSHFNEQVKKQGISSHLERFCAEIETMSLDRVQSRFERLYPYLKRKEGNLRLIARIRRIGNDAVLCWLTVFRRGDREYLDFLRDRENFSHYSLDAETDDRLESWLSERKASVAKNGNGHSRPTLSSDLQIWLKRPGWEIEDKGTVIYESKAWLTRFKLPEIRERWQEYNYLISLIADGKALTSKNTAWSDVKLYGEDDRYILFSKINTNDIPSRSIIFLLAPFVGYPSETEISEIIISLLGNLAEAQIGDNLFARFKLDDISLLAKRAYPSYLLADENIWLTIEKEEEANLALSAEEKEILHSVSTQSRSLPLFLNGSAGSGKSTMLFHLFADYCYRHLQECQKNDRNYFDKPHPLFIAYSDALTQSAKERVLALLKSHHRFLAYRGKLKEIPDLNPFFQPFRTILWNLLPDRERDRFPSDKYISFHRFRQLCLQLWRGYSPEKCWLAIRNFIKGYHLDERNTYGTIEDYQEIPKKERTVSIEEFKRIYNNVWKWYEKYTAEEGAWDERDLIRQVLQLKCYSPEYTVIFCDEAQDFTRLELQLIMRLSVFSQYDLERQHIDSLPFAFAGDPFQTLNPTGFRWGSLKSTFYNEVITALAPTGKLPVEMNFTELECNYRSISPIVGVTNLIQLWRRVLFNLPELKPQRSRKTTPGVLDGEKHEYCAPQKFILGKNIESEAVKKLMQDTVIIVPCDEGGELDYCKDDELLSEFLTENSKDSPWNILSSISAKGLEFKQVILYKFGELCQADIWDKKGSHSEAIKYFFNKLYVAASRATERLFIIDSEIGERNLWNKAGDRQELVKFIEKLEKQKDKDQWQNLIQLISFGVDPEAIVDDDLQSIALTFETNGLNTENPEFLKRAQQAYQRIGDERKAAICQAWVFKLENQLLEAGSIFLERLELLEAWNCLWQKNAWDKLLDWYEIYDSQSLSNNDWRAQIYLRPLVSFMAWYLREFDRQEDCQVKIDTLKDFTCFWQSEIEEPKFDRDYQTHKWQNVITAYGKTIKKLIEDRDRVSHNLSSQDWQSFVDALQYLSDNSREPETIQNLTNNCQQIVDRLKQEQEKAINSENKIEESQELSFPEGLVELAKVENYDRIILEWEKAGKPRDLEWLQYVASALEAKQSYANAFFIYAWLDNLTKVKKCFLQTTQGKPSIKLLLLLLQYYARNKYWSETLDTLQTYRQIIFSAEAEEVGLKYEIIYELACSQLVPESLNKKERKSYEQIFKELFDRNFNWQKYLSMQHIGIALEKIGSIELTLEFYEKNLDNSSETLARFARERWLATKHRQEQDYRQQIQIGKAQKTQEQLRAQAEKWQIDLNSFSWEIPEAPKERLDRNSTDRIERNITRGQITGLPKGILVNFLKDGAVSFEINHLAVKVLRFIQQVLITDVLTNKEIRIDGKTQEINVGSIAIKAQGNEGLSFGDRTRGYQGNLVYDGTYPRVKLNIQDLPEAIEIIL